MSKSKSSSSSSSATTNRDSRAGLEGSTGSAAVGGDRNLVGIGESVQSVSAGGNVSDINIVNEIPEEVGLFLNNALDFLGDVATGSVDIIKDQSRANLDAISEIQSNESERFTREIAPIAIAGIIGISLVFILKKGK